MLAAVGPAAARYSKSLALDFERHYFTMQSFLYRTAQICTRRGSLVMCASHGADRQRRRVSVARRCAADAPRQQGGEHSLSTACATVGRSYALIGLLPCRARP